MQVFSSVFSWTRLSFMWPILARESLRAAASDCSLFRSRESSALQLSVWRDRDVTKGQHNTNTKINQKTFNDSTFTHFGECLRKLGFLSLQQLPLNLPLLVSFLHCRQLSALSGRSDLALIPLLLSVSDQCKCRAITILYCLSQGGYVFMLWV